MIRIPDSFDGLRDRDYRAENRFVAEGRIVIEKAIENGVELESLVCVASELPHWESLVGTQAELSVMTPSELESTIGYKFHRGVLAIGKRPPISTLAETSLPAGASLLLWNVTDPDNFGSLVRSAAAFGFGAVMVGPGCADPFYRKTIRASMGNVFARPLVAVSEGDLDGLKAGGRRVIGAALDERAVTPERAELAGDFVLVLGNEGWGLPPSVLDACDGLVAIPMASDVDSLNVGAAGAVLMYALTRTRTPRAVRQFA